MVKGSFTILNDSSAEEKKSSEVMDDIPTFNPENLQRFQVLIGRSSEPNQIMISHVSNYEKKKKKVKNYVVLLARFVAKVFMTIWLEWRCVGNLRWLNCNRKFDV